MRPILSSMLFVIGMYVAVLSIPANSVPSLEGFGDRFRRNPFVVPYDDYQPERRERIFRGDLLERVGKGLIWLAIGILCVAVVVAWIGKRLGLL